MNETTRDGIVQGSWTSTRGTTAEGKGSAEGIAASQIREVLQGLL